MPVPEFSSPRRILPHWLDLRTILMVAAGVRLATLVLLHNFTNPNFFEWGDTVRKYLAGRGFSYYTVNGFDVPTAYMPPAYSYIVLMAFSVFGDHPLTYVVLQVVQAAAGVFLVYLIYRFTLVAWNEQTALVAAAIGAVYPPFVYMPVEMHSINFYIVLTLAVVYYLYLFLAGPLRTVYVLWAALLLGVLIYFRAEAVALPFLYAALLLLRSTQNWRAALLLVLLPLLLLAPWTIRNYRALGAVVVTTTAGGINLWYGHNLQANGTQHELWPSGQYVMPDASLKVRFNALPATADYEIRMSAIYRDEALKFMRTHPKREVELALRKLFYFWTIDWNHPKARHVAYALPALAMVALFWMGVAVNWKDLMGRFLPLTVTIIFTNLLALVFFVLPRYRLGVEPIMIPFAADALVLAWHVGVARKFGPKTSPAGQLSPTAASWNVRAPDVIVVAYNSAEDIRECVGSILADFAQPIVIDNGSSDATLQILAEEFPQVLVVRNPDNSYSRAANVGFAHATSDVVILSNADVIFPAGSIQRLSQYLIDNATIGVLGPQQVFPGNSWQRSWAMASGLPEALLELFFITSLYNALRRVLWPIRVNRRALNVGYVDGAVMAIRRLAFDAIGGFDERFPFSSEETDFCVRVRRSGWRVVSLPTVDVQHRRGGSSSRLNWSVDHKTAVFLDGTRRFVRKYHGPLFGKCYFAFKAIFNLNMMLLCEVGSSLAPVSLRSALRRKGQIHRSYWNHLRPRVKSVAVRSSV